MKLNYLLLIILLSTLSVLSACGFHLRGSQPGTKLDISTLHIQSLGADRLAEEVKSQLEAAGTKTVQGPEGAEYILKLEEERINRTVLSVSALTGKAEEFQLTLTARVTISRPGEEALVPGETISIARDYTFDEDAVLGKFSEEGILEDDLMEQAAARIIRRLAAVVK